MTTELKKHHNESITVEQSESWFLGILMWKPERLMECKVGQQHFLSATNRFIFEAITTLDAKGHMIDVVTVADELDRMYPNHTTWLALCGKYVSEAFSETFFHTAQKVMLERHRDRTIKSIAETLYKDFDADGAIQALMDLGKVEKNYSHSTAEAAMAAIEKAREAAKHGGMPGLCTGLAKFDKALGGLQAPDLIVIGGRPAMGKTSVIINWMLNHDCPAGFFSTEQPHDQIGLRMISMTSGVPGTMIRTASYQGAEEESMAKAVTKLASKQVHIYDRGNLSITELMRAARAMKYNHGVQIIYVDYIQRIRDKAESRRQEVANVVTKLKSLALELNIPIVALAQVNRDVEKRPDRRPRMADLKEAGEIEQEADTVAMLYRDEVYNEDTVDKGILEILIDKNRHGPVGRLKFAWLPETMRVQNLQEFEY